jgi:hypothetical protein
MSKVLSRSACEDVVVQIMRVRAIGEVDAAIRGWHAVKAFVFLGVAAEGEGRAGDDAG